MVLQTGHELISHFVESLEFHPNGSAIIGMVEEILANDSGEVSPQQITSLKSLSNNNTSLLIDFWILRASILTEEGLEKEAMRVFYEATQWAVEDRVTWLRIINFFSSRQEYLKASFFLVEAQEKLKSEDFIQDEFVQLVQQLENNLSLPPGILSSDSVLDEGTSEESVQEIEVDYSDHFESNVHTDSKISNSVTTEALNAWEQALECFKEGTDGNNLIYLQAFIHYAHSTVRELLRLGGNFKAGLERQVAEFGLFDYNNFFIKLNRLRNAVIHDNYSVSKEEAISIHSKLTELFNDHFIID